MINDMLEFWNNLNLYSVYKLGLEFVGSSSETHIYFYFLLAELNHWS